MAAPEAARGYILEISSAAGLHPFGNLFDRQTGWMIHYNSRLGHGGNCSILRMLNESLAAVILDGPQPLSPVAVAAKNDANNAFSVDFSS
jgi:hypothetical protein